MKKLVTYISALVLAASLLTGCNNIVEAPSKRQTPEPVSSSTVSSESTSPSTSSSTATSSTSSSSSSSSKPSSSTSSSKPASSSTLSQPTPSTVAAPAVVSGITNETFYKYTTAYTSFANSLAKSGDVILYNFTDKLYTGIGKDGSELPTEAEYGLTGYLDGQKMWVKAYNNSGTGLTVKSSRLEYLDKSTVQSFATGINFNYSSADTSTLYNGLYRVQATFSNNKTVTLYFYVNGSNTYLCNVERSANYDKYVARRKSVKDLLAAKNITPRNSITLEGFHYPTKAFDKSYRDDTQLWIDLSKKLVKDEWSDEYKLYTFVNWISENIAYDYYKVNTCINSRARYFNDHTGTYSVWNTRTGVCLDVTNILAIMCRANGIPASSIASKKQEHVWNVVYINGRWLEVDCIESQMYGVFEYDTTKRKNLNIPRYAGLYDIVPSPNNPAMPSDAIAGDVLQINSNLVY